ncbi:MAG: ribonuclease HII [Candidatus Absconditabacteria bacterium]|nr:ribonuclease HII [Candidatus Absconditabacteria bacterium]MDD3868041.1 ribonuclease HII [Candidatus Absconditabacteria bacterium]MDD4714288.1 ribonuclease HII [Candidatus Absconditabacteria bacterium]
MKTLPIYIDEAGRGPLAGPMYVGLILPLSRLTKQEIQPFTDSKKLSEKKREEFFAQIQSFHQRRKLIAISTSVSHKEIDRYGMTNTLNLAISRGLRELLYQMFLYIKSQTKDALCSCDHFSLLMVDTLFQQKKRTYQQLNTILQHFNQDFQLNFHLYIDGNKDFRLSKTFSTLKITTIIDGDAKIKEIGMASILAKVSRDRVMSSLPEKYKKYNFPQHKGYGTLGHKTAIEEYGPSDIHRKLFLKKLFPNHQMQKELPKGF